MARVSKTGRTKPGAIIGGFVALPYDVLDSPGYRSTSPPARAVLIVLARRFTGRNNGALALSVRDAASEANVSPATASRALQELDDAGLIEMVDKGSFTHHRRLATTWRLNWRTCDLTGKVPARRYRG
jgi:hypothetical protein